MTDRELMQHALDALEGYARNCRCEGGGAPCDAAEALRARLAQPEQPQIVWIDNKQTGNFLNMAPPQREWQGLTNDEVNNFAAGCHLGKSVQGAIYEAAAKLKEKNT